MLRFKKINDDKSYVLDPYGDDVATLNGYLGTVEVTSDCTFTAAELREIADKLDEMAREREENLVWSGGIRIENKEQQR